MVTAEDLLVGDLGRLEKIHEAKTAKKRETFEKAVANCSAIPEPVGNAPKFATFKSLQKSYIFANSHEHTKIDHQTRMDSKKNIAKRSLRDLFAYFSYVPKGRKI